MIKFFFLRPIRILYAFCPVLLFLCLPRAVPGAEKGAPGHHASPVIVENAVQKNVSPQVTLIGTTVPHRKSTVAAEIGGLVVSFPVRNGHKTKKGDILVRIETRPLKLQLESAKAHLAEAKENHANAQSELNRSEALFKQKSISSREYEKALYASNAIQEKIMGLEAEIELIEYRLGKSVIRAPFNGFVVEEHTQVGQWLKEGEKAVTLAEIDPILVKVPVPDRYIHYIRPKQKIRLEFDFLQKGRNRNGFVRDIIPQGNEKARTFPVQISVKNRDFSLFPGMSCKVTFPSGSSNRALLVNKDAIITDAQGHHLFVVRDGKAVMVPVSPGQAYGNFVVVEGDLSSGDLVVVEGNERLRPGQKVKTVEKQSK
jgi:RND family efflux transporter MFP subunit